MTRQEIVETLDRRLDALQRHDVNAFAALHSEDCFLESPMAGKVTGREGTARIVEAWLTAFPDATFAVEETLIDGDRVALTMHLHGTHMGALMGLPASGKTMHLPMTVLLTLRDGLVVHERRIYDFTGLLVQLGLLKAKPV